jgi:hypothetical protein
MKRNHLVLLGLAGAVALAVGCTTKGSATSGSGGSGGDGGGTTTSSSSGDGVGGTFAGSGGGGVGGGPTCATDPNTDDDQDGLSEAQGDCNDCDKNVTPGGIEVINPDPMAQPADEDCDGVVDNVLPSCDGSLELTDPDAKSGARAIDLCQFTTPGENKWGVLDAKYVRANGASAGSSRQFGILSGFGPNVNVQLGSRMLALSSGGARTPGQPEACNTYGCPGYGAGTPPAGFPQNAPGCVQGTNILDDVGLELKIRAPKNATGFEYQFKFYSFEFAEYVCTKFNDQYIALVNPPPAGSLNGNISFDNSGNPVSVNIAFFDICDPIGNGDFASNCGSGCPKKPSPYCPLGPSQLVGTGFETSWGQDAGATVWLKTQSPVVGGDEFTIRFAIWDTGDSSYDSTVLVDGFKWIANGGTVVVGTDPVGTPK